MKKLLTAVLLLASITAFTQGFIKKYNIPNVINAYNNMAVVYDDGFVFGGYATGNGNSSVLLVKTDLYGEPLQTCNLYYGSGGLSTNFLYIDKDMDGNIYVAMLGDNSRDLVLAKVNNQLQEVWRKKLGTLPQGYKSSPIIVTHDNHVVVAAAEKIFKADAEGNLIWEQFSFIKNDEYELSKSWVLHEGENGDIYLYTDDDLSGTYFGTAPFEAKLKIFGQDGTLINSISQPGSTRSVISDDNSFFTLICCFYDEDQKLLHPDYLYIVKHDFYGVVQESINSTASSEKTKFSRIIENADGNIVAFGTYANNNKFDEIILYCITKEGNPLWTNKIQLEKGRKYQFFNIHLLTDGGYIIVGFDETEHITPMLIRVDADGNVSGVGIEESEPSPSVKAYPNPASEVVVFQLQQPLFNGNIMISDITGRQVAVVPLSGEKTQWKTEGIRPGMYLYKISAKENTVFGKILIQ